MTRKFIPPLIGFLSLIFLTLSAPVWAGDPTVLYTKDDPKMNAAIINARSELPVFLKMAKTPPATWENHGLKVAIQGSGNVTEHIWVSGYKQINPENFTGRLANEPNNLDGLHLGDMVTFTYDQISDWNFVQGGRGYGYYTVRVLLERLSKAEAANLKRYLAPNPTPKSWPNP